MEFCDCVVWAIKVDSQKNRASLDLIVHFKSKDHFLDGILEDGGANG